jgi:hypothetical protein
MKKHYFIVECWVDNGQPVFHIDHSSLDARFPDGAVWNGDTEQWEDLDAKEDVDRDSDLHGELMRRLGSI